MTYHYHRFDRRRRGRGTAAHRRYSRGWRATNATNTATIEAEAIRGQARDEDRQVKQREARADETAAKARAAQAEADVKAAQATGLQQQAAVHRSEAATSRDELQRSNSSVRTRWIRPRRHPKRPGPPTARNTRIDDGLR